MLVSIPRKQGHMMVLPQAILVAFLFQCHIPAIQSFSPPIRWKVSVLESRIEANKSPNEQTKIAVDDPLEAKGNSPNPSALPSSQSLDSEKSIDFAASSPATVVTMITQDSRRILIEELGYRRVDVSRLRPELAQVIVSKRMKAPDVVPDSWFIEEVENQKSSSMQDRLAAESRFPLKFPLLGFSTIIIGKGLGDLLITLIKVSTNFPGSSWGEEFLGIPVYLIDFICLVFGGGLFSWTWSTMKIDGD